MPVLKVLDPLAAVDGSLLLVVVSSYALSRVGFPKADENVAIRVNELATALSKVVHPSASEHSAINPILSAKAMAHVTFPLANVDSTSLEFVRRSSPHLVV
eukprot:CAMPEP_0178380146 /NCGR_PEP_ID=MMETSP0689_2-20121128/5308_1 /TAXON_ID=160604 /ORGANISM="Amphidinium massartii, Strain CS-259" /LENGTH=100 /DNA_ID=CAMNT_0020000271 /DNA_START=337 /DNA_END=639 /DNA_ORIENTATION=-